MGDLAPNWRKALWPDVRNEADAETAIKQAWWAAVIVAGVTTVLGLLSVLGLGLGVLIDAGLFALIAVGLSKKLRTAAVCGLLLYVVERVYMWSLVGFGNPLLPIVLTLAFINGVRGTFAWQKHRQKEAGCTV
jgi:hypothetical protein